MKQINLRTPVISILVIFASLNTGCGTGKPTPVITETYTVNQNSHINEDGDIISGENYAFSYLRYEDPNPIMSDDESSEQIVFEISKNDISSFSYSDSDLEKLNTGLIRRCFLCLPEDSRHVYEKITKGNIKGQKNSDGTWKVEGNFLPYTDFVDKNKINYTYSFSGNFKLKN